MSRRLFEQLASWGRSPPTFETLLEFFSRMRQTRSWDESHEKAFKAEVSFAVRWVDGAVGRLRSKRLRFDPQHGGDVRDHDFSADRLAARTA
jgi:hypothetical protein